MGRVAVVTGGGSGIGRAIATRLALEGSVVGIVDRDGQSASHVRDEVLEAGGSAHAYEADITRRTEIRAALARLVHDAGPIDVLVNNAGIGSVRPFLEIDDNEWRSIIDVNLYGTFVTTQEAAVLMMPRHIGRIVNVASLSAHVANGFQAAYSASKAAVISLTRSIAFELGPHGITANAVSPGPIRTQLTDRMVTPDERAAKEERSPLRRLGDPEEVAGVVAFLASDDASYLNGAVINVDGGLAIAGVSSAGPRRSET